MKTLFLIFTFFLASTIEVSISQAASRQTPAAPHRHADMKEAVAAWKRLIQCQSIALGTGKDAPYNRCLENAMPPGADKFEQMKITEFLLLGMPVRDLGHCPPALEPAEARRQAKAQDSRFACFLVSTDDAGEKNPLGGEIEFAQTKNGELKVRRVRYSF